MQSRDALWSPYPNDMQASKVNWHGDDEEEFNEPAPAQSNATKKKKKAVPQSAPAASATETFLKQKALKAADKATQLAISRIPLASARRLATEAADAVRSDMKRQAGLEGPVELSPHDELHLNHINEQLRMVRMQDTSLRSTLATLRRTKYTKLIVDVLDEFARIHKSIAEPWRDPLITASASQPMVLALVLALREWAQDADQEELKTSGGRLMMRTIASIDERLAKV